VGLTPTPHPLRTPLFVNKTCLTSGDKWFALHVQLRYITAPPKFAANIVKIRVIQTIWVSQSKKNLPQLKDTRSRFL